MLSFLYVYSDHSILECYNLFSGVELSMRSLFVIFELALMLNQRIQLSNDVTVTLFLNQSSQNFAVLFVLTGSIPVQNLSKIRQETKKLQDREMTSLWHHSWKELSNFLCLSIFSHWCIKFQVDWRSDKGITGGGTKHPSGWEWLKKPGLDRVTDEIFFILLVTCGNLW